MAVCGRGTRGALDALLIVLEAGSGSELGVGREGRVPAVANDVSLCKSKKKILVRSKVLCHQVAAA